jgi:hypothetical protein
MKKRIEIMRHRVKAAMLDSTNNKANADSQAGRGLKFLQNLYYIYISKCVIVLGSNQ